jgi:hypothetical protein
MPHQKDTAPDLESFSDQLFFGLLSNNPDSAIEGFIKKYVPVLHKRPETGRNRTI